MESTSNNCSRIGIELGAPLDGNEKSSVKLAINFGKGAADLQTEKLKSILGAEDPNLSIVIVFTPVPGKHQELETILLEIIEGKLKDKFTRDISKLFGSGLVSHKIIHSGSNVILLIKPGPTVEGMLKEQVGAFLGMGFQDLANSEQAAINLNLASAIEAYDLIEYHNKKYSTVAALWESSMIELTVKTIEGSKLDTKFLDILKSIVPFISAGPLPLLQLLKTVDVDFSFRGVEELPPTLKQTFLSGKNKFMVQTPRVPQTKIDSEELPLVKRITEVLQTGVDVYATLESVAAAHLSIKILGIGVIMTTPQDYVQDKDYVWTF